MTEFFRLTVLQVVNNRCHCNISAAFIHADHLLCDSTAPSQVVYRATIDSIGNYSSTTIVGFIEEWIRSGANLTNGINFVTFDPYCSVQINASDAPCSGQLDNNQPSSVTIVLSVILGLLVLGIISVTDYFCHRHHHQLTRGPTR